MTHAEFRHLMASRDAQIGASGERNRRSGEIEAAMTNDVI